MSPELLVLGLALVAGYAVGSIPAARLVARTAVGPGWRFLAFTADLAKGVIPVAIGTVTFSWAVGWAAGLGALLGAGWPALGRLPGGRGLATFGGVAYTLAPPAGTISTLLALAVLGAGRLLGRDARIVAAATAVASYPPLFHAVHQDVARLLALAALALVAVLRLVTTREP